MDFCLSIIEYSNENFNKWLTSKYLKNLLFLLLKLLENNENINSFLKVNGFNKLLSLKSKKRSVIETSK